MPTVLVTVGAVCVVLIVATITANNGPRAPDAVVVEASELYGSPFKSGLLDTRRATFVHGG